MLSRVIIYVALLQVATAHDAYGTVLAEQLNQYCSAHCQTSPSLSSERRVGKAGPRGPPGVAGSRGPPGKDSLPERVDYSVVEEMIRQRIDKALNPRSCSEAQEVMKTSGVVHRVKSPEIGSRVSLYCDMETDGGNWTVLLRRKDGSVNFNRNWTEYAAGFGDLEGEFWIGLEKLHRLTSAAQQELRVDLGDWEGGTAFASYTTFSVDNASTNYRLSVGGYSGTAGDSLRPHNNMDFSTFDVDNDKASGNCAKSHKGGWWFNACDSSHLTGIYHVGGTYNGSEDGVEWQHWKNTGYYSMKFAEMKIRPRV